MDFDMLKLMVTNREQKMKQMHFVLLCLNFVEQHPDKAKDIGLLWNSETTFLVHSGILEDFTGRKANTINRNFRAHGFSRLKSSAAMREKIPKKFDPKNLPDPTNWFQRQCDGFTIETTENEAIHWKVIDLTPKCSTKNKQSTNKEKKKKTLPQQPPPQGSFYFPDGNDKLVSNIGQDENSLFAFGEDLDDYFIINDEPSIQADFSNSIEINDFSQSLGEHNEIYDFSDDFNVYY